MFENYTAAIDELNILTTTSYESATDKDKNTNIEQVTDDVLTFLILAYQDGVKETSTMLGEEITVDISHMEQAIYKEIAGKTFEDRVRDHVEEDDLQGLQMLVESEYHRVFNSAEEDAANDYASYAEVEISKTWRTVMDNKVRDTHAYLEGMTVGLDQKFYTYDGDSASSPGQFSKASNNVNCRCVLIFNKG